jgi:Putative peptidoglycan binding domain
MKIPSVTSIPKLGYVALAALSVLALAPLSYAKDKDDDKHGHSRKSKSHKSDHDDHDHDDHARQVYSSHPRSGFILSLGTGYAGRGYYYGPPNSSYYYQRPDVHYYATREAAPREYYGRESYGANSTDIAVQRALARVGYYQGSIDGQIGPQSQRAIARYQQDHGLRPTGVITQSLLNSLGL